MTTSSRRVAEVFGKPHKRVTHAIAQYDKRLRSLGRDSRTYFRPREYLDVRGKVQVEYDLTRDGFSALAMGFTGDKAFAWKVQYVDAFNAMEAKLLKDADKLEWKAARLGVKQVRRSFTDTLKNFVEYATQQGSKSASMYFTSVTNMEYQALGMLERQQTAIGNFRDTLDLMDIAFLSAAEMIAKVAIEQGMENKLHYKEIYILTKEKVKEYANSVSFAKLAVPAALD